MIVNYNHKTFMVQATDFMLSPGPSLQTGRRAMGCGMINESGNSSKRIFIVAGHNLIKLFTDVI
jgi:hypothetical protein